MADLGRKRGLARRQRQEGRPSRGSGRPVHASCASALPADAADRVARPAGSAPARELLWILPELTHTYGREPFQGVVGSPLPTVLGADPVSRRKIIHRVSPRLPSREHRREMPSARKRGLPAGGGMHFGVGDSSFRGGFRVRTVKPRIFCGG